MDYIDVVSTDDSDVRIKFTHDDSLGMNASGNSNYNSYADQEYRIQIDMIGYEGGPRSKYINFINRILPNCNELDSNSYQARAEMKGYLPIPHKSRECSRI